MGTIESLKALIAENGGDSAVLCIMFNNAYTKAFSADKPFNSATDLIEEKEYFKFTERDTAGLEYLVYKPVEYVESVIFAKNVEDAPYIDRRYIRG